MVRNLYEVEKIVSMKQKDGKKIFRVKWVGFPSWQNTWQPEQHLSKELVQNFMRGKETRKEKRLEKCVHRDRRRLIISKGANIKIISMNDWDRDQGLTFNVMYQGRRKLLTREQVFENFSEKLARFYLGMLLEKKK